MLKQSSKHTTIGLFIEGFAMAGAKYLILLTAWMLLLEHADALSSSGECITDLKREDCPKGFYYMDAVSLSNRCPGCVQRLGLGEGQCRPSGTTTSVCAPGLKCVLIDGENRICVVDEDSCFGKQVDSPYPPNCTPDGKYAAVQCKGDRVAGRCFCADEDGKRIFGMEWMKDAKDMTCACSRRRADLEKTRNDVTLHCTPIGNYEAIQCDSGLCWCADEKTGDAISAAVQENLISQLPCYDSEDVGSQYTRVCESKDYAISLLRNKLNIHGTTHVTMEKVYCDYDGTYGRYQIDKGITYCSWKDGKRLGSWQVEAGVSLATINCYCARDTTYFEESGKTLTQDCAGNGNYNSKQQLNGQLYCVDSDGFPVTKLLDLGCDIDCPTMTLFGDCPDTKVDIRIIGNVTTPYDFEDDVDEESF